MSSSWKLRFLISRSSLLPGPRPTHAERILINDDHWHQFQREIALKIKLFLWQFLINLPELIVRRRKNRKRAHREANEELKKWMKMFMTNFVECKHEVNVNQFKHQIKWKRKSFLRDARERANWSLCKVGWKNKQSDAKHEVKLSQLDTQKKTTANVTNVLVTKWLNDDPATEALLRISRSYHWAMHWNFSKEL